jgi:PAS domain S-box-containing protein
MAVETVLDIPLPVTGKSSPDQEAALRHCIRDLVALSSLPALWIKADAHQIANALAQVVVSVVGADFGYVTLDEPRVEALHPNSSLPPEWIHRAAIAEWTAAHRPKSHLKVPGLGEFRDFCVPLQPGARSELIVFSRRPDFPNDNERVLIRVAGNLASIAIQRWAAEHAKAVQTELLEWLHETGSALYSLTDGLFRAQSSEDVYDAALDAIVRSLRCQRASILLFDEVGVMRFVAWRGLSEGYRRAVDGHSPWKPGDVTAIPISIEDIAADAGLSDELKSVVIGEGIAALSFIPIIAGGQVIGKFMAYYDRPHRFEERETNAAIAIARQLGFGLERLKGEHTRNLLAAVVESSSDAIITKGLDGIIQTWNKGAEHIFGFTADEAIGKPVTILFPPDRYDEEPGIIARIRRGEVVEHYETIRRRKDGSLVELSVTVSPVREAGGRIVAASNISRDISDRKRTERQLRDSERKLHDLLEAIPAAIYTTDADGKVTYYNQAAVEFAGRAPTVGSDEWCVSWKLYRPDGTPLPHDQCPMAVALKEGRPIRNAEAVAERPDGTRVPFIPYPTPIRDSDGKVVGAINMLVDISERKQAESYQQTLLNELNHRVKNNMQVMQSLLEIAVRNAENDEARSVLSEASHRVAAMAAAQRALYGARSSTRFHAPELIASVCRTVQSTLPSGIEVVCEAEEGEFSNDTAMPLALILNELLVNAAKYGCDGSKPGVIRARLTSEGRRHVLSVEDEGPGFDLNEVHKRASGLILVRGLAAQLRGQLQVSRNPSRVSLHFEDR